MQVAWQIEIKDNNSYQKHSQHHYCDQQQQLQQLQNEQLDL